MKFRSFIVTLILTVTIILGLGAGSWYAILAQSPLNLLVGGIIKEPEATLFIPRQSPLVLSLLVNPERLEALAQLEAPLGARRRSHIELQQVKQTLVTSTGLDYEHQIQPWLGEEITLAVTSLDFDRNIENGVQPGYLLVVSAKDTQLAREFLQLSFSEQALSGEFEFVYEDYKGVKITAKRPLLPGVTRGFASAIVGDTVLFANNTKVLRNAINNVQVPDLNLKNDPAYQKALLTINKPRLGLAFVNLPALSAWIARVPNPETPEIAQMLTVTLALQPQGLTAETALFGVAGLENQMPALNAPVGALAYLPSTSILTAAGTDLKQLWTQITEGLEPNSPLAQVLQQGIASIETPLGIDLGETVFPWLTGEYALSLVSNPDNGDLEWLFVAEKTADGEVAIAHLDQIARDKGLSVGDFPLGNSEQKIIAWTQLSTSSRNQLVRLNADVQGAHTSIGNYEIFATSVEALSQTVSNQNSLLESPPFKAAIASLPSNNDGYFYIDWNQGQSIFTEQVPIIRIAKFIGKPLFDHLRSLTLSSQGSNQGIRRATVFLNLTSDSQG